MKDVVKLVLLLISLLVLIRLSGEVFRMVRADYYHKRSVVLFNEADFVNSYEYSDKAVRSNGYEADYLVQKAKTVIGLLSMDGANKKELKEEAREDINKAISLNGNNLVIKRNVIPLYYFLSLDDLKKDTIVDNFDQEYLLNASDYLNKLSKEHRDDVGVVAQVATYQKKLGLMDDYVSSKEKVRELRPDLLDWYLVD
jgi:hypothetical protein